MNIFRKRSFDKRYETGNLPWDSGTACNHLVDYMNEDSFNFKSALDLGCGTGTNALHLASKGLDVFACDFSPKAIEIAKEKSANPKITFEVLDVLSYREDLDNKFDFVFDRGCFHCVGRFERKRFAKNIRQYMQKGGIWLLLCGSTDETRNLDMGPPRLSVSEVSKAVEPYFKILEAKAIDFSSDGGRKAWRWILTPR